MVPGDWACSNSACNEVNFKRRNNCRKCGKTRITSRPTIEKKPGDWICSNSACSELNFASRNNCRKCNNAKSTGLFGGLLNGLSVTGLFDGTNTTPQPVFETRAGDWTCPNTSCNQHNFQFRDICRLCNTPKNSLQNRETEVSRDEVEENVVVSRDCVAGDSSTSNLRSEDADNEPDTCVICLDQPKTHAITKCGHLCYCGLCGFNINKCPICRETYNPDTDLLKIFSI